ncbi:MAG: hypothetical protein F6K19_11835 [Cyanothece sp. SIO1E1]|nr:hypothetical protein [Cyanothece sp. SIO1E1]
MRRSKVTDANKIIRAAIHPGIGIARVGNSTAPGKEGYYIGPEVTEPASEPIRDASGAIKRQAARFRIYGYNAAGEVVKELNSNNATIEWTVHLANRKAQWYKFVVALDIPEWNYAPSSRRNPDVKGEDRKQLAIDPGPRTIKGKGTSGSDCQFNNGTIVFPDKESGDQVTTTVPLGELRTDEVGHLLILGGFGNSGSPTDQPIYDPNDGTSFLNSSGWFDDISDGPVTATVTMTNQGRSEKIPVESSWVVVAPPNYAPDILSWRTLYDLLIDTYVEAGWLSMPTRASFAKDILPVLLRLSKLQWVNQGFANLFGKGCPMDFSDPELIAKLALPPEGNSDLYRELRQIIFNTFRPANTESTTRSSWPWIYGDAFGSDPSKGGSPRNNLTLSKVRMQLIALWAEGHFDDDRTSEQPPSSLDEVPLSEQPAMLDRAALHFCLADAFHPGCELTWPMRHSTLYTRPFRIRHRSENEPEPDYGQKLTQEIALQPGGPLSYQGPGDLTRWMGLPWQADTGYCRSGYDLEYDPYLPTYWPAHVPNQILTEENYDIVVSGKSSPEEKLAAFYTREFWLRALPSDPVEAMLYMVESFGTLGIIESRDGLQGNPDIPSKIFVEILPEGQIEQLRAKLATLQEAQATQPPNIQRAGWDSIEQLEAFRRVKFGNK